MSDERIDLNCPCGATVYAKLTDAGGSLACAVCNQSLDVPGLGKLRQMLGREAYITNSVEAINKEINLGNAPAGKRCLLCQSDSTTFHNYIAICEQSSLIAKDDRAPNDIPTQLAKIFSWLAFGWLPFVMVYLRKRRLGQETEVQGRDVTVAVTLPVCDQCCESATNALARRSRKLMRQVPLYRELLEEYPSLRLRPA